MKKSIFVIFLFASSAFAQKTFDLKNASKYFDIKVNVAECDDSYCRGKAKFSFYKKGATAAYQVIDLPDTLVQLGEGGMPLTNVTMLYDEQSVVNVDDYNFDGMQDVAICDGSNGSYNGPSYRVYLSSRAAGKFVFNKAFTELGSHLGMFVVDKAKRRLRTFDKSGCCYHITEEFAVRRNRPVKVFMEEEQASFVDEQRVKVTTTTTIGGKEKVRVKYVKREE